MADHRLESERIEALKLVRCFITTKEGMQHISDGVMRAVIAIAEQSDEKLRNACLETLGEMGNAIRMKCSNAGVAPWIFMLGYSLLCLRCAVWRVPSYPCGAFRQPSGFIGCIAEGVPVHAGESRHSLLCQAGTRLGGMLFFTCLDIEGANLNMKSDVSLP
jgi:hypothetical protein